MVNAAPIYLFGSNPSEDGAVSHATFMIQTAIITRMDSKRPIAAGTGYKYITAGMFRFATGMFVGKPVTGTATRRDTKLPFDTFGNATARLRPRYRDGYSPADGNGHRVHA